VNHTRFPKEDHLPKGESRDNKVTKGDRAEYIQIRCKERSAANPVGTRNFYQNNMVIA